MVSFDPLLLGKHNQKKNPLFRCCCREPKNSPSIITNAQNNMLIGRTEIISNDQNPNFVAQFILTYIFEEVQSLRFEVYDADSVYKTNDATHLLLPKQDFQGTLFFSFLDYTTNLGRAERFQPAPARGGDEHKHETLSLPRDCL